MRCDQKANILIARHRASLPIADQPGTKITLSYASFNETTFFGFRHVGLLKNLINVGFYIRIKTRF